jgi:hypothetical protein
MSVKRPVQSGKKGMAFNSRSIKRDLSIGIEERFTPRERRLIRGYRTPTQVQGFLHGLRYNNKTPYTIKSFRQVIRTGSAHCLEGAITAAVILEQYGYPPLILDIESKADPDHVVYLYRSKMTGLWGAIGKSREPGLCGRKAVFKTVRSLVYSYFDAFIDLEGRIIGYCIGNLNDMGNYNWRFSEKNLWKVDRFLDHIPHKKIRSSNRRYKYWHDRYLEFKERFPHANPMFYDNRWTWLPGHQDTK